MELVNGVGDYCEAAGTISDFRGRNGTSCGVKNRLRMKLKGKKIRE